jgi:hypothetical protein
MAKTLDLDSMEIGAFPIGELPSMDLDSMEIDTSFAVDVNDFDLTDTPFPQMPSNMKDTQPETDVNRFIRVTGQYKSERDTRMKNMDIAVQNPLFGFEGIKGYEGPTDIKGADTISLLEYMPTRGRFDPVRGL